MKNDNIKTLQELAESEKYYFQIRSKCYTATIFIVTLEFIAKFILFGATINIMLSPVGMISLIVLCVTLLLTIIDYALTQIKLKSIYTDLFQGSITNKDGIAKIALQESIENNIDVNTYCNGSIPAISYIAARGDFEAFEILLNKGANINIKSKSGYFDQEKGNIIYDNTYYKYTEATTLQWAIRGGNKRIVETLIKAGADMNSSHKYDTDTICVAANYGNPAMVKIILENAIPNKDYTSYIKYHYDSVVALAKEFETQVKDFLAKNPGNNDKNDSKNKLIIDLHLAAFNTDVLNSRGIEGPIKDLKEKLKEKYLEESELSSITVNKRSILSDDKTFYYYMKNICLENEKDLSLTKINRSWKALSTIKHTDKGGDEDKNKVINESKDKLYEYVKDNIKYNLDRIDKIKEEQEEIRTLIGLISEISQKEIDIPEPTQEKTTLQYKNEYAEKFKKEIQARKESSKQEVAQPEQKKNKTGYFASFFQNKNQKKDASKKTEQNKYPKSEGMFWFSTGKSA